jgi:putative serine protease PepD
MVDNHDQTAAGAPAPERPANEAGGLSASGPSQRSEVPGPPPTEATAPRDVPGPPAATREAREGEGGRGLRVAGVLGVALLMLGAATGGALVSRAIDDDSDSPVSGPDSPDSRDGVDPAESGGAPEEPLSRAAAAVLPSVVSISVGSAAGNGQGSGVVIGEDGTILTNHHVVAGVGSAELTVTLPNGTTTDAEVVGSDPATDLAVIRAEADDLTPATLGSSSHLNVGDTVLAIGSPLGLDGSVSAGIVSALNRAITLGGGLLGGGGPPTVIDAIQTDAAINPGNSGGALINAAGEVVGINTAIASLASGGPGSPGGSIGVGFAIPIDAARDIADRLIVDGEVQHAYLGVRIADAEDGGAVVGAVDDGSPAADAGLELGDVVTEVDGTPIRDAAALTAAVRSHRPDDTVTVTYRRDGDERTTEVTLGTLPG